MANNNIQTFEPHNLSISEIFSGTAIYNIPNYQRQYCWNNKHLSELWEDLYESFRNKTEGNDCYFLGSIVVIDNGTGYQDLIDGQQRITTLMIMLNVLYKTFPDLNINKSGPRIIKNSKLKSYIYYDPEEDLIQLQLQTDPKYDATFKKYIVNVDSFANYQEPTKNQMKSNDPKYNFINTARFFYEQFKSLDEEELNEFVNYIFFNTNIIKIVCVNEAFAIKLFQVLNDRGEDLKPSDIIKSYIIGKYNPKDPKEQKAKDVFNNNWKAIEDMANRQDFSIDDFIVIYEYFKLMRNPKRQVTDEIKDIIDNTKIQSFVSEIYSFSECIENIYKSNNPIIYSLRYIPWKNYVMAALATAYYVKYQPFDQLLFYIRRFYYLSLISGKNLNQIKQTSFNLIEAIEKKKSIEEIKDILATGIKKYKMIRSTYEALDNDVYGEYFLKPLMLSLEYERREKNKLGEMTNTTFTIIDKHLHMDHILPKKYKESNEWPNIDDQEASYYLNKIGNMALLLDIKNLEALNHGFDIKKDIYLGIDENNQKGKTIFEYTQDIVNEKEWNTEKIKERTETITTAINKILEISRDDIIDEITEEETENKQNNQSKWLFNGMYYTNKDVRIAILEDYIKNNNISKFEDIPEEIRKLKVHSHEAIKENLTKEDEEMNYAYKKVTISGMTLYSRDYGDLDDTIEYINTFKKYYKFSLKRNTIDIETRSNINEDMVKNLYQLCKRIYSKEIVHQEAIDTMVSYGMNSGSAHIYITCFEKMMNGTAFKKFPNLFAIRYFIENIFNDYGKEKGLLALKSFKLNIEYRENIDNGISKGYYDLFNELNSKYNK